MSSISLQFGPEWMRSKQASTTSSATRSGSSQQTMLSPFTAQLPTSSLYSSFVANNTSGQEKDISNAPFKYSKEEMLQIWMDGGGHGPLGVEIELWEGVVNESGGDPIGLREFSDLEKKLFASPLNSELRRRQSHDILPNSLERPKLSLAASSTQTSFGQPRFSPLLAKKRKEEPTDSIIPSLRRLSLVSPLSPPGGSISPAGALPSPRMKWGANSPAFENIMTEGSWRKKDEINDTCSIILDHNTSTNGQPGEFTDAHIISTAASGVGMSSSDKELMSHEEVQAIPINRPSLGGVSHKHIGVRGLGDYDTPFKVDDGYSATPPGLEPDPVAITWVYRDPKGTIQGPFSASIMQKWYDEGYFAPGLLVKRSQLDDKWIMVGELAMQARNGKLFTQLYPEYKSSGLFSGSNLYPQPFDHFRRPLVQSDSLSANHSRHPTVLQHPTSFGGMLDSYSNAPSGTVSVPPNPSMLSMIPQDVEFQQAVSDRAAVLQPVVSRSANFEHSAAYRDDHIGYSRVDNEYPIVMDQTGTLTGSQRMRADSGVVHNDTATAASISFDQSLYGTLHTGSSYDISSSFSTSNHEKKSPNKPNVSETLLNSENLHRNVVFALKSPLCLPESSEEHIAFKESAPTPPNQYASPNSHFYASEDVTLPITVYPLATQDATSRDTTLMRSTESPKLLSKTDDGLSIEGMYIENLIPNGKPDESYGISKTNKGHLEAAPMASAPSNISGSTSVSSKPAWRHFTPADDVKLGLREIQEAETRTSDARRLAERQKEWNTHTINTVTDMTLPNTWGLSISQARNSRPSSKETIEQSSSIPPPPVWTNPTRIKQTMREIQEEEEMKKKTFVKDKESGPSANRRAYAESTHKSGLPSGKAWTTVGANGRHSALTTNATAPHSAAARQTPITTTTAQLQSIVSPKPATNVINRPSTIMSLSSAKPSSKSNSSSTDDLPIPPSPEFIQWLRDALRGFNVGFNTEEFMTMLLAFPLDFPPSTVEVIQDMVYMNSDTMDGRRFAAEFCNKRKGDAANRPKNTDGRQSSLADIVKTQPKPLQSELPFKVVKKKGKK